MCYLHFYIVLVSSTSTSTERQIMSYIDRICLCGIRLLYGLVYLRLCIRICVFIGVKWSCLLLLMAGIIKLIFIVLLYWATLSLIIIVIYDYIPVYRGRAVFFEYLIPLLKCSLYRFYVLTLFVFEWECMCENGVFFLHSSSHLVQLLSSLPSF